MFMLEFLNDPQRIHAATVHLPIALAILGIPLVYLMAVVREKEVLRGLALGAYVLLILTALASEWTGERANAQVPPTLPTQVYDIIDRHEWMAQQVWIFAAATAVLIALSAIRLRWFQTVVVALAMIGSLATGGWVALTGHYGGELVYEHGVGTPGRALNRGASTGEALPPPAPAVEPPAAPVEPVQPPATPFEPAPGIVVTPVPDPEPLPAPAPMEDPVPAPDPADPLPWADPVPATPESPVPAPEATGQEFFPAIRPIVPEEAARVSFVRDIRPILAMHCIECHDAESAKGDYRVDTVAEMLKPGRKAGPGVVPFQPDDSSVVAYIRGMMQPQMPRRRDPLTEDELHQLRMWIAAGAVDDSSAAPAPAPADAPAAPPAVAPTPAPEAPAPIRRPGPDDSLRAGLQREARVMSAEDRPRPQP